VSLKSVSSVTMRRIIAAGDRLTDGLRSTSLARAKYIRETARATNNVDEAGAHGIDSLPAMRALFAEPKERALQALRVGLNGHYGRRGKDGTRLYLDIGKVETYRLNDRHGLGTSSGPNLLVVRGGIFLDGRWGREDVGRLVLAFSEGTRGRLVVRAESLTLERHVRGRGFTEHLIHGLRDYFKRSGVDHVKVNASLTHGGRGWAGLFDWDPENAAANRREMLGRIDKVMTNVHNPTDRKLLDDLQTAFNGPPESWPSPRDLRRLKGETAALGEQILNGSDWHGIHKL
jgi:hypothetical protein